MSNDTRERFVIWRLIGDLRDPVGPDGEKGGRRWAAYAHDTYDVMVSCYILAHIYGFDTLFWACLNIAYGMNEIDAVWNQATSPGEGSDGVVQASSQAYPGAEFREVIQNADSHVGETRSPLVRDRLFRILDDQFNQSTQ